MKLPEPHRIVQGFGMEAEYLYTQEQMCEALAQQEAVMRKVLELLGPQAPECCGCAAEWNEAIKALEEALGTRP